MTAIGEVSTERWNMPNLFLIISKNQQEKRPSMGSHQLPAWIITLLLSIHGLWWRPYLNSVFNLISTARLWSLVTATHVVATLLCWQNPSTHGHVSNNCCDRVWESVGWSLDIIFRIVLWLAETTTHCWGLVSNYWLTQSFKKESRCI